MYETESNAGLLEKYLRTAKKAEKLRNREDDGPSAVLEQLEADELALEDAVLDRMLDASERKAIAENLGGIIGLFEKLASAGAGGRKLSLELSAFVVNESELAKARAIVAKLSR